jgi:signal transduction histidine kinase
MMSDGVALDELVAELAEPQTRAVAAGRLARHLGGDFFIMFAPDPELGILLPAPGFSQTLRNAGAWRDFLDACRAAGEHTGELPSPDTAADPGERVPARGIAGPVCIAVLLGPHAAAADLTPLVPALRLLGSIFNLERRADAADVRVSAARHAAQRAGTLARTVQSMHAQLEEALAEAHAARTDARTRTAEAESLAEELGIQAGHLEEQAAELEALNEELAQRTQEAVEARERAETADRAKSDFLASMSHELRTPINAIIGYAELMDIGVGGDLTEEQRHHVNRVRASSRHLLSLINDVLDLAKIEAGHMIVEQRKMNVRSTIADAVTLLALQAADKGVTLDDRCTGTELTCVGDPDRVRQVLANLLSNAVKFTETGGAILVRCGTSSDSDHGASLDGDGPWTYVEVADTGIGMAPEEAAAVFQPFVQAAAGRTRAHGGTGLGLTISRQLARLMGGDLTLRSEKGTGSTVTLWLPTTAGRAGKLDESIRVGVAASPGR